MNKIILITGATGSIGRACAIELAQRSCNLILLGRNQTKLAQLKSELLKDNLGITVDTALVDLSEPESIMKFCADIKAKYSHIEGLIHSAAIYETERKVNSEGIELMFATNHLGPFLLTNELLDLLKEASSARIMTISAPSSARLNFEDLLFEKKFSAIKAYEATKTANLLFAYKLAQLVSWSFVSSFAFHPGVVKSNLLKNMPAIWKLLLRNVASEPAKVGKVIAYFMLNTFEDTLNARLVKIDGSIHEPSEYFKSVENLSMLWEISSDLCLNKHQKLS